MAKAKVDTKDYVNLPTEKWNVTTFREYMKALHQEKYGTPYVANNYAVEGNMLKQMVGEYGKDATKRFIGKAFAEYRNTNPRYAGLNFGFMYSYLRERYLPLVLKDIANEEWRVANEQQATEIDEGWL